MIQRSRVMIGTTENTRKLRRRRRIKEDTEKTKMKEIGRKIRMTKKGRRKKKENRK
jgi:hypothetical protein